MQFYIYAHVIQPQVGTWQGYQPMDGIPCIIVTFWRNRFF